MKLSLLALIAAACAALAQAHAEDGAPAPAPTPIPTQAPQSEADATPRPPSVPDDQPYDPDTDPYSAKRYAPPQKPGLPVDAQAPRVSVIDHDGTKIDLEDLWSEGPLIVVFVKGGWCGRCANTLRAWKHQLDRVDAAGATLIVVTPLKPENILPLIDIYQCEFPIFSDRDGRIGRAFNVRMSITEPEQLAFYKQFTLDLSTIHADGTWDVPAHASCIIDTEGVVRATWGERSSMRTIEPRAVVKTLQALDLPTNRAPAPPTDAPPDEAPAPE